MIKLGDFYLDNILIDEKSHGNALIYDTSCNALIGSKPLGTRLDKIDGVIRIYNGTRYLTLFSTEKLVAVYDKIRSLRTLKTSMIFIFSYYFAKIKTGSYGSLSIEKKSLTWHTFIILIESVLNKDKE